MAMAQKACRAMSASYRFTTAAAGHNPRAEIPLFQADGLNDRLEVGIENKLLSIIESNPNATMAE